MIRNHYAVPEHIITFPIKFELRQSQPAYPAWYSPFHSKVSANGSKSVITSNVLTTRSAIPAVQIIPKQPCPLLGIQVRMKKTERAILFISNIFSRCCFAFSYLGLVRIFRNRKVSPFLQGYWHASVKVISPVPLQTGSHCYPLPTAKAGGKTPFRVNGKTGRLSL